MTTTKCSKLAWRAAASLLMLGLWGQGFAGEATWPDLSAPARAVGGGESDAAVVVGIDNYTSVPRVPGAELNARDWHRYLIETRRVPPQNVKLLTEGDAAREDILEAAAQAAARAGKDGTLWFVFVGHGAPEPDGKDGLLVGADARPSAKSLQSRSVARGEILKALGKSRAAAIRVVLDACFSGQGADGEPIAPGLQPLVPIYPAGPLDPRVVVLTATKPDQFAGPLPGANRPAFSYLVLGGLRGWAAQGLGARVTADDLRRYASNALEATLRGRKQEPDIIGKPSAVVGVSAGETGPKLGRLSEATSGADAAKPALPPASPALPPVMDIKAPGVDFSSLDLDVLEKYYAAMDTDKSGASPKEKVTAWRRLAKASPKFAGLAAKRAAEWQRSADRISARDRDWEKLSRLLALETAPEADKELWTKRFLDAYWQSPGITPASANAMVKYLKEPYLGQLGFNGLVAALAAGLEWVDIPGGTFMMGSSDYSYAQPVHNVAVKPFQMAKTLVTNKQYQACVKARACTPSDCLNADDPGDDRPVVCVDWNQARAFSAWVGGRLPTEAEFEYAARGAGKDQTYPWGNEGATCDKAQFEGCSGATKPVCSLPAGNTAQGLCDMGGNAWEWVQDWGHDSYDGAPTDGSAWENPAGSYRVARGGPWDGYASYLAAAHRGWFDAGTRNRGFGFRPVR